jgi:Skp family chaperone for outer membrane proteins
MNLRKAVVTGLAMGVVWALMPAGMARADDAGAAPSATVKVAVCDPLKVLGTILEGKDDSTRWKQEQTDLQAQAQQRKDSLTAEADGIKVLKQDSPEFEDRIEKFNEDQANAQAWLQSSQVNLARKQHSEQKVLFQKILDAIASVAKTEGVTLVLNASHPEFPDLDKMDANAFVETIMLHVCLYSETTPDITQDVEIYMDKGYKK